jgi:Mce-associated membrane protein
VSAPTPSWYDLLGVEPDASADEIRAAWKSAIADLEPTDRRFRTLNQAAEVLLDPELRAEYDHSLAPAEPTVVEREEAAPATEAASEQTAVPGRVIPAWLLAALGILTAVLVGLCVWQAGEPTDEQVKDATTDAQAAAERAIVAIVSYDYRSLDDDQAKASAYMTEDFGKDYEALFAVIRENAPETKTILTTDVVASGVVRSGDDRVQVFMFINNPRTNAEITTPEVGRNQVTVTMEKVGDDWLVDDLKTTLPSS